MKNGLLARRMVTAALLPACLLWGPVFSSESQAQSDTSVQNPPAKQRKVTAAPPRRPAPGPSAAVVVPAAMPVPAADTPLGNALSHQCATAAEPAELVIPGAKGDIKLDRCYRGRNQLSCEFSALTTEAKALLEKYRRILDAKYPEVEDVGGMCRIQSEALANDIESTREFADRFSALKSEYEAKSECARRVQQSFKDVALSDLAQAPNLLKSILETLEAEMKAVSDVQGQISEFAERIASSQRAMATLQKVHRAVCMTGAPAQKQVSQ